MDVGCGTNSRFKAVPRGDVNCDVGVPRAKIPNFFRCDAKFLPFRSGSFNVALLFNVLEHIEDYEKALNESLRVAEHAIVRTDGFITFRNIFTVDHKYVMLGFRYVKTPRVALFLRKILETSDHRLSCLLKSCFRVVTSAYYRGGKRSWHYYHARRVKVERT